MVFIGVVLKGSLGSTTSWLMYQVYSSCGFQQGDNIGITSSTCRHYTLSNSIMFSDSYTIPTLSFSFLYPRLFNSKNFLIFWFRFHTCNSNRKPYIKMKLCGSVGFHSGKRLVILTSRLVIDNLLKVTSHT